MRITESDFLWYWKNRMSSNSWRIADRSENFQNNPLYYPRGDQWLIRYYVFEDNARFNGWCGPISHLINSPNWESMFEIREKKALFFFTPLGHKIFRRWLKNVYRNQPWSDGRLKRKMLRINMDDPMVVYKDAYQVVVLPEVLG